MRLPRLYAILDTGFLPGSEALYATAQELVAAGCTLLQYRDKSENARVMLEHARELKKRVGSSARLIMVITTLTTIGYQEVHPLSHAGRVFNVFVIVSGVSLLLLGVGLLSQALLEFELQSFFGRRRMLPPNEPQQDSRIIEF